MKSCSPIAVRADGCCTMGGKFLMKGLEVDERCGRFGELSYEYYWQA